MLPETILTIIYECIDQLNRQLPVGNRLEKSPNTSLIGEGGTLDSLAVINFLVILDDAIARHAGRSPMLLDDTLLMEEGGPAQTLGYLAAWLADRI